MNYLGQQLSTTLLKAFMSYRYHYVIKKCWLRGVEALLANLLNDKFDNPHAVLDTFVNMFTWP